MVLSSSEQLSCHPELLCSDITVPDLQGYAHLLTAKHPTNAAKNMVYCRKMDLPQFRKILAQCRDTKAVAAGDIEKLTSHFDDGGFISKAWSEEIRHFQMPQKVHNEICQQIKGGMFPSRARTLSINRTYHNVTTKDSARFCPQCRETWTALPFDAEPKLPAQRPRCTIENHGSPDPTAQKSPPAPAVNHAGAKSTGPGSAGLVVNAPLPSAGKFGC